MLPPIETPTLNSLKAVTTLRQLAPLLGLKPAVLAMQLYKKDKKKFGIQHSKYQKSMEVHAQSMLLRSTSNFYSLVFL